MRRKKLCVRVAVALAIFATAALVEATHASAQETVLYNFDCGTDGCEPTANLIFDATGNLYGTSPYGGDYRNGVVFELSPQITGGWGLSVLHSFNLNGGDGATVEAGVIFDSAGNLYGTTANGGAHNGGTVFELSPTADGGWTEKLLHSFGNGLDGSVPNAGLIVDAAGNLYGTTTSGGVHHLGTAFELIPTGTGSWTEKQLHNFSGSTDGAQPWAGLTFDSAGNLYGTASGGGPYNGGVVFELSPQTGGRWSGKVLHSFGKVGANGVSETEPYAGVVFDQAGNLYGTTYYGGIGGGGVVYELTRTSSGAWKETTLHNFGQGSAVKGGYNLFGGVVFDAAGNLYGTTAYGGSTADACGSSGCGVVFQLSPSAGGWSETVLETFNYTDGGHPFGYVAFDSSGNIYGTTTAGGSFIFGTVFKIRH
jgi:uncharacterized repeat protein (TIGR03803 family)